MKKAILTSALLSLALLGCTTIHAKLDRKLNGENPYEKPPFYMRYVNQSTALDRNITRTVNALRSDPRNAALHNDLGALLLEKGFPKDASLEFRRAVDNDPDLYAAWYNLGLIRQTQGDYGSAQRALRRTLDIKPGHAAALFQLGLIEEQQGHTDAAVELYAKAFRINRSLLDIHVNPRILDTKLADRALLMAYELDHAEAGAEFQATPTGYMQPKRESKPTPEPADAPALEAPSKQPDPVSIVTPAPAATDLSRQAPRPTTPAQRPRQSPQSPQAPPPQTPQPPPPQTPQGNQNAGGGNASPVFTLRPNASAAAQLP
jgi:hypothetical protein